MKKLVLIMLATSLVVFSCKKPGCTDPEATNYKEDAKTDDGTCTYPEIDPRLPVLGYYLIKDSTFVDGNFSQEKTYTLRVRLQNGEQEITEKLIFDGLWGQDRTHFGYVNKDYVLTIPMQPIESGSLYEFSGSGSFYGNYLSYKTSYNGANLLGDEIHVVSRGVGDK